MSSLAGERAWGRSTVPSLSRDAARGPSAAPSLSEESARGLSSVPSLPGASARGPSAVPSLSGDAAWGLPTVPSLPSDVAWGPIAGPSLSGDLARGPAPVGFEGTTLSNGGETETWLGRGGASALSEHSLPMVPAMALSSDEGSCKIRNSATECSTPVPSNLDSDEDLAGAGCQPSHFEGMSPGHRRPRTPNPFSPEGAFSSPPAVPAAGAVPSADAAPKWAEENRGLATNKEGAGFQCVQMRLLAPGCDGRMHKLCPVPEPLQCSCSLLRAGSRTWLRWSGCL